MPSSSVVQPTVISAHGNGPCTRQISHRFFRHCSRLFLLAVAATCASCGSYVSAPPPASLTVTPPSAQRFPGTSVQFAATVQNSGAAAVNWQVNNVPGGNSTVGTIGSSGLYTAPTSVPNPPTVTVTAVSQSDAAQTGSSSVTIQSLSAIQGPLALPPALSSVTTSHPRASIAAPRLSSQAASMQPSTTKRRTKMRRMTKPRPPSRGCRT